MRLIHAPSISTPQNVIFRDFTGDQIPPYAILSHTWGTDEVIWPDFANKTATQKPAFQKVFRSCAIALTHGLDWIWIDSCCIDKSSSAELSEAINSMFAWYEKSVLCIAYLQDLSRSSGDSSRATLTDEYGISHKLRACKWFTRGWTLQELIAPHRLLFYSEDWVLVGGKSSFAIQIGEITGIDSKILLGEVSFRSTSVARRMSWASRRQTTRQEDIAYCLLGIFDVSMPMLYGEGSKAFLRLQEEIIKQSNDHTLFAWQRPDIWHEGSLLASSPDDFASTGSAVPDSSVKRGHSFQLTNGVLRIDLALVPVEGKSMFRRGQTMLLAPLACSMSSEQVNGIVGIYLRRTGPLDCPQYHRSGNLSTFEGVLPEDLTTVHVSLLPLQTDLRTWQLPRPNHQFFLSSLTSNWPKLEARLIDNPGYGPTKIAVSTRSSIDSMPERLSMERWSSANILKRPSPTSGMTFSPVSQRPNSLILAVICFGTHPEPETDVEEDNLLIMVGYNNSLEIDYHACLFQSKLGQDLGENLTLQILDDMFHPVNMRPSDEYTVSLKCNIVQEGGSEARAVSLHVNFNDKYGLHRPALPPMVPANMRMRFAGV